jgi:glycosyltransferase involved in cell wall biosynthesis
MNKEDPLISVIIPTYNRANLLTIAILSVINQTYKNWELIIVDDGSTDNTKQIVEEFIKKDPRIKYFYKENGGQGSARNLGIKNAQGEYIAFLDSDDEFLENKIKKSLKIFNEDKNIGMIYSDAIIIGNYLDNKKSSEISKPYYGNVYKKLLLNNFITTSTVVVKKEVFLNRGFFNESSLLRNFEDYDMWLRIAKKYKIGYIPEVLVKYNFSPKINFWEKRKNAYKAMIYIYLKNLKIANLFEKFIVIWKLGEYILKLIVANILIAIKR